MNLRAAGRRMGAHLVVLAAAAVLAGCATTYRLDNTVQSFSGLEATATAPLSYRFERLPSQAAAPGQAALEALADPALFQAGLRRDDAQPRYSVQVGARIQPMLSPWADPWDPGWGWGPWGGYAPGYGYHGYGHRYGGGVGLGFGFGAPFPRMEQPWYHREVSVVVRELASNRVVYETRAVNDGPWLDSDAVLGAMFSAALQGFPNPPPGARRVDVLVGGTPAAPVATTAPATVAPAAGAPSMTAPAPAPVPAR